MTFGDIFALITLVVIVVAIVFGVRACDSYEKEQDRYSLNEGDYVKITKKMDSGNGKIGVVQVDSWGGTRDVVVRYVKEIRYLNQEKTEFVREYSKNTRYARKCIEKISKGNVVEKDGQFEER